MMQCAWFSATLKIFSSLAWQAFCRILFPESSHAARAKVRFKHNVWWFGSCLSKDLEMGELKLDLVYKCSITGCNMVGKIVLKVHLSLIALDNTLPIKENGGTVCAFKFFQFIWNASTIHQCGSSCQLIYLVFWWHNLDGRVTLMYGVLCAQVRELPQSHCGDNREGILFSWWHISISISISISIHISIDR